MLSPTFPNGAINGVSVSTASTPVGVSVASSVKSGSGCSSSSSSSSSPSDPSSDSSDPAAVHSTSPMIGRAPSDDVALLKPHATLASTLVPTSFFDEGHDGAIVTADTNHRVEAFSPPNSELNYSADLEESIRSHQHGSARYGGHHNRGYDVDSPDLERGINRDEGELTPDPAHRTVNIYRGSRSRPGLNTKQRRPSTQSRSSKNDDDNLVGSGAGVGVGESHVIVVNDPMVKDGDVPLTDDAILVGSVFGTPGKHKSNTTIDTTMIPDLNLSSTNDMVQVNRLVSIPNDVNDVGVGVGVTRFHHRHTPSHSSSSSHIGIGIVGGGVGVGVGMNGIRCTTKMSNKFRKRIRRNIQANRQLLKWKRIKQHQLNRREEGDDRHEQPTDLILYDTDGSAMVGVGGASTDDGGVSGIMNRSRSEMFRLSAFCTCESFEISELIDLLESSSEFDATLTLYADVLHIKQRSLKRDIFLFEYGVVVFFNVPLVKEQDFLQLMKRFERVPLNKYETEDFDVCYDTSITMTNGGGGGGGGGRFNVSNDEITLGSTTSLEKLSVAFAVAQCTRLSVYEERISRESDSSKHLSSILATTGSIGMSSTSISKKLGTLFLERNNVNLHFDVLDSPEFFWQEDKYKYVYDRLYHYLELGKRVDLLNKRLVIMKEFFDLLNDQMERKHANKLEWIIIWLIVFEVAVMLFWNMTLKDILGFFNH